MPWATRALGSSYFPVCAPHFVSLDHSIDDIVCSSATCIVHVVKTRVDFFVGQGVGPSSSAPRCTSSSANITSIYNPYVVLSHPPSPTYVPSSATESQSYIYPLPPTDARLLFAYLASVSRWQYNSPYISNSPALHIYVGWLLTSPSCIWLLRIAHGNCLSALSTVTPSSFSPIPNLCQLRTLPLAS